jgi:hypothetical protein
MHLKKSEPLVKDYFGAIIMVSACSDKNYEQQKLFRA